MSVSIPVLKRRGFLWWGLGVVLVVLAATVTVVVARSHSAPPPISCNCRRPPSADEVVPQQWQTAVAQGDTQAAWELLTPAAQRRYRSVSGLRAALAGLTPRPKGTATWRPINWIGKIADGGDTPNEFVCMLIEDETMRLVSIIVVHSLPTDVAHPGRVDPDVPATVRIMEPAPKARVFTQPRVRVATSTPDQYVAVQAGSQTPSVSLTRDKGSRDEPFFEPLTLGPALIVAVDHDDKGHLAYGSVQVTVG